jgi:hypothetical protein
MLQTYEHRPRYHERPPTSVLTEAVTLLEPDADVTKCKDGKRMRRILTRFLALNLSEL